MPPKKKNNWKKIKNFKIGRHNVARNVKRKRSTIRSLNKKFEYFFHTPMYNGEPGEMRIYANNVKDAAKIIVKAIEFEHDLEPINVNGEEISIFGLANLIADIVGLDRTKIKWDSTKPDGITRKVLNGDKLKKLVPDFKRVALKDGLRKTIEWYIANKQEADARE